VRGQEAVAKRYAKALFDLAREQGRTEAVGQELAAAIGVFQAHPELGEFLRRPGQSPAAKRETITAVAGEFGFSTLARDFVVLLALRGRVDHLPAIAGAYADLADTALGRLRARVRTAVPLTGAERGTVAARLGREFGGREVILDEVVDDTLLGGFVAQVGSTVLDGSLDGQLARIRERLTRGRE
jgi:F-type H+-transporting ATPase subunit delta